MVDRSELYPGAVVTVKGRLSDAPECLEDGSAVVAFTSRYGREVAVVRHEDILSVEPRPLAVGDRVQTGGGNIGTIDHIRGVEAVLVWKFGSRAGMLSGPFRLSSLTRIPEEPAPAEKAMRFKVGDRVFDRDIGRGTVTAIKSHPHKYEVRFDEGGIAVCPESDLSPAPAEERAP